MAQRPMAEMAPGPWVPAALWKTAFCWAQDVNCHRWLHYPLLPPQEYIAHQRRGRLSSVQCNSVVQLCLTLCNPMDHSTPGFPVYHQLPEFTQTHVHRVGDAIQPSHPLSSPSPPALNLSQHQGLFKWVSSLHQVVKVLEFQLHLSFQWTLRADPL